MKEGDYVNLRQLAVLLSVSRRTLRNWISDPHGPLPHYKIKGLLRFKTCEVEQWIQSQKIIPVNLDAEVNDFLNNS